MVVPLSVVYTSILVQLVPFNVIITIAFVFSAVFVLVFIGIFMVRSITATKLLHERLLHSVIRSPMSFFDTTPIGRIVNRFSADTDTIDNDLPTTVQKWLECVFRVISTLVVISYSTPLFCAVIVPFGVAYFFLQVRFKHDIFFDRLFV